MKIVRVYSHTPNNPLRVTDYATGSGVDISDKYGDLRSKANGIERITAVLTIWELPSGAWTETTWNDGSKDGLLDLGDIITRYGWDLSNPDAETGLRRP